MLLLDREFCPGSHSNERGYIPRSIPLHWSTNDEKLIAASGRWVFNLTLIFDQDLNQDGYLHGDISAVSKPRVNRLHGPCIQPWTCCKWLRALVSTKIAQQQEKRHNGLFEKTVQIWSCNFNHSDVNVHGYKSPRNLNREVIFRHCIHLASYDQAWSVPY